MEPERHELELMAELLTAYPGKFEVWTCPDAEGLQAMLIGLN